MDKVQCTSKEQSLCEGQVSNDVRLELGVEGGWDEKKHARTITIYLSNLPQEEFDNYEVGAFYDLAVE